MTATPHRSPRRWLTTVAITAASLGIGVVILAFMLSFAVLRDLAGRSGIPAPITWAWPLIVDVTIVVSMLAIVARRGVDGIRARWPWTVFSFFTVVSVFGNAIHTVVAETDDGVWTWLRIVVCSVPPIALLCSVELVVGLLPVIRAMTASVPDELISEPQTAAEGLQEVVTLDVTADQPMTRPESVDAPVDAADQADLVTPDHAVITDSVETVTGGHDGISDQLALVTDERPDQDVVMPDETSDQRDAAPDPDATDPIPAEPSAQIDWVAEQLSGGRDFTKAELAQAFAEAGLPASPSTVQRRLREARALVAA